MFFPICLPPFKKFFMWYFLFLAFTMSSTCFGQKKYHFDYLLEYEFKSSVDSSFNKTLYYITNSRDNSYFAKIRSIDTLSFGLVFHVQDLLLADVKLKKYDFFNLETLTINCESNYLMENIFKFRVKEYEFNILTDTLIDNKYLSQYKLEYTGKRKRKKSRPIGTNHYIIKDSTQFHLPILTHSTAFEEWKKERNIPNGIFQEKIFYDYKSEISYKYILKEYQRINKTIIIPEECLEEIKTPKIIFSR